jgi:osmotically-inducible protein OsmY
MRSDSEIKTDVEAELKWDPDINSTDIAVAVKDGVVTLTGFARSYAQKWEAEKAAKRVAGVRGVANDIEVQLPVGDERPDPEIAREAVSVLKSNLPYSYENIKVVVKSGWVTLEGTVEWEFQRARAEHSIRHLKGVKGVTNLIALKPSVSPSELKRNIEEAFKRSAEVDAGNITVEVNGNEVTLRGTVKAWAERQEAERTAWRAPGVTKVINQIIISP